MALRSHDAAAVERLALPQSETRPPREQRHAGDPDERRSGEAGEQLLQSLAWSRILPCSMSRTSSLSTSRG